MIRLSPLQYNMLRTFSVQSTEFYMTIAQAQSFDQRPFRSMLIQRWIVYRPGRGFHITREGRHASQDFENHDIARKNPSLPLTSFFDPTQYGLTTKSRKPKAKPKAKHAGLRIVA